MIRQDYILRLIEQFFQILSRAMRYREEKRYVEALAEARKGYKALVGVDATFIDSQSAEGLIEMGRTGLFGPEQLVMIGKLLREEAEALEGLEVPVEAQIRRIKSLALFFDVFLAGGAPSLQSLEEDADAVLGQLERSGLPLDLARRAPLWHERRGRYSEAEDAWYRLAEAVEAGDRAMFEGEEFYGRLESLSDTALDAGGVPREEIAEGRQAWRDLWVGKE